MSALPPDCIRCQTQMEEGITLDHGHFNALSVQEWLEGPPERSFWFGLKTKGKEKLSIHTYRCPRCGYLESYANP
jgi:hypothetical protein